MTLDFSEAFSERTPRIVQAGKLHRTKERRQRRQFLVEGPNAVDAAVATAAATDVFVTETAAERFSDIVTAAGYLDVYVHPIDESAAKKLSDTVTTTGIYAVCNSVLWSAEKALGKKPRLVLVAVETSEPGNAGTLIRIADAMGADAVIFAGDTVDPQAGKTVRSSAGSLFHLPVARERSIEAVWSLLKAKGLTTLATAADGEVALDQAAEILQQPTAWVFGNEAQGLPEYLLESADHRVSIPIRGRAESLNLASAASICLYQSAVALAD